MGAANVNGQFNRPSLGGGTDNGENYGSGTVKIGAQ